MALVANNSYIEPGYTATDDVDGDITANVIVTGTVDTTAPGRYKLYYDVTDSSGNTAIQQARTVIVTPLNNRPPVTDAGADQVARLGQAVTLNGSGSADPDGDAVTYTWRQTSGAMAVLSNYTARSPTFMAPDSPAVLSFDLTVADPYLLSSSDTVTVHVLPQSKSITITHVNTGRMPFTDGMAINSMPRFEGTSSGIEKIRIVLCDQQVGGNNLRADG